MKTKINTLLGAALSLLVTFALTQSAAAQIPAGMALVPAGSFTMGDPFSEGSASELPLHTVYVSAFYMDQYEMTKGLWDNVYNWAVAHGYRFDYAGSGKAADHPVHTINWFDAVKWCNARSEMEGRVPAYYTSTSRAKKSVCRSGQVGEQNNWVNWTAGYRLPTEAEWEKAARGGASGHRFPWSDVDTIDQSRANYQSVWCGGVPCSPYDVNPAPGYHPTYNDGVAPYTSPVGSFAANGYGLFDMAGNVTEWCWDWSLGTYYSSSPSVDPRGPDTGTFRIVRGGTWDSNPGFCKSSARAICNGGGKVAFNNIGFRSVLP